MKDTEEIDYQRILKEQDYANFREHAQAPIFRRCIAALFDLVIVAIPIFGGLASIENFLTFISVIVYFLFRDWLFGGRSFGKLVMGLVVVHNETLAPCTLKQSIIRNSLYAVIAPVFLLVSFIFFSLVAIAVSFISTMIFLMRFHPLSFVGFNEIDGSTIPDSWAQTKVLTPEEIQKIRDLENTLTTE
ncbi:MAG: RDD family protein [Verrucomicrobiota bacterium]